MQRLRRVVLSPVCVLALGPGVAPGLRAKVSATPVVVEEEILQPVPPALAEYQELEFTELDDSLVHMREAATAWPFRAIPLVVLPRGQVMAKPADLPGGLTGELLEGAWQAGQE